MDPVAVIEDLIVSGSEGFFDQPLLRESLHVTIRIARDFYDFLLKTDDQAPAAEIDYIIGTIRSGLAQFFALAHACSMIDTRRISWPFDARQTLEFASLRSDFIEGFERLVASADATVIERLAWLLGLVRLELLFVAHHFPAAQLDKALDRVDGQ